MQSHTIPKRSNMPSLSVGKGRWRKKRKIVWWVCKASSQRSGIIACNTTSRSHVGSAFQDFDESSEVSNDCNCTFKMSGAASLRNVAVWMFHSKFLAINQDIASNESWSRTIDLYFSFEKLNRPRLWWSPSYRSRRTRRATSSSGSSRTFWYFRNIDTSKKWYLTISVIFLY